MNKKFFIVVLSGLFLLPGWNIVLAQGGAAGKALVKASSWIPKRANIVTEITDAVKQKSFEKLLGEALDSPSKLVPLENFQGSPEQVGNITNRIAHTFGYSKLFSAEEKKLLREGNAQKFSEGGDKALLPLAKALYLEGLDAQIMAELGKQITFSEAEMKAYIDRKLKLQRFIADMENGWGSLLSQTSFRGADNPSRYIVNGFLLQNPVRGGSFHLDMVKDRAAEIDRLLSKGGINKGFFLLNKQENAYFASLSLADQRKFAQIKYQQAAESVFYYYRKGFLNMTANDFRQFYAWRNRAEYFRNLSKVLETETFPRSTISLGFEEAPNSPFAQLRLLPPAQRMGRLQFDIDRMVDSEAKQTLVTELARQKSLYERHAFSQTFGVPYHQVPDLNGRHYDEFLTQIKFMFGKRKSDGKLWSDVIRGFETSYGLEKHNDVLRKITNAQQAFAPKLKEDFMQYYKWSYEKGVYGSLQGFFERAHRRGYQLNDPE
ncbi:MAG: hypothetical protein J6V32_01065 [Elusimicrobiaceae bacterium]|nr:hypothetical protein [Elusimicrobiaceae bacterium]